VKITLKDFQLEYVELLVKRLRQASGEAASGDLQSVGLSAPTGSGKTVMMTAAIERLIAGDDEVGPDPGATFLWVTDDPDLNEQTRRKMALHSSVLGESQLQVIMSSFDEEVLQPGRVYFVNTQKLGKGGNLNKTIGDLREFTFWSTASNTVRARRGSFYVIIDEAHRGMTLNQTARAEANSIVQKFIKGSNGELVPVPLIVGVSATMARFRALVDTTHRTKREVEVDPVDVRESGLLKERVLIAYPDEEQPSDMTLLDAAARRWQTYSERWDEYHLAEPDTVKVEPVLLVQVEDGTGKKLSNTDLGQIISVIDSAVGPLPPDAFAHAFQESAQVELGDSRVVRYLAPADIDGDPDVKVVLFKTSLNTGWDCPRAEVMMSFRRVKDHTLIAQLVGRMVRTPLARSIDSDDRLNSVRLHLPHFDSKGLEKVVDYLTGADPGSEGLPVDVQDEKTMVVVARRPRTEPLFEALGKVPSYVVPRRIKVSQVRRLMRLARRLAEDGIDPDASESGRDILLDALDTAYAELKDTDAFKELVAEKSKIDLRVASWIYGTKGIAEEAGEQLDVTAENLDDLFSAAGRKLGEGLHLAYWKRRVAEDSTAMRAAKLELFALATNANVVDELEAAARTHVNAWLKHHKQEIDNLGEEARQGYQAVRQLAGSPEECTLELPDCLEVRVGDKSWDKHLFADADGMFSAPLNTWERSVVETELAREDAIGWLRNIDRKDWALTVPYTIAGELRPLFPDFIVFRRVGRNIVVDILDPHGAHLPDAPAKAVGLAQFADKHWDSFGRIELIIYDRADDKLKRLDLVNEQSRNKVKSVTTREHLLALFNA